MPLKYGQVLRPAIDRFAERVALTDAGCLQWIGGTNGIGYGQFYRGRSAPGETGKTYAHRWSYEWHRGPVPEGMVLDHLCRNRACVNPEHLEPVTNRENLLRGVGASAQNARKDECPEGHPYAGENLYVAPGSGHRHCRECAARRTKNHTETRRKAS